MSYKVVLEVHMEIEKTQKKQKKFAEIKQLEYLCHLISRPTIKIQSGIGTRVNTAPQHRIEFPHRVK